MHESLRDLLLDLIPDPADTGAVYYEQAVQRILKAFQGHRITLKVRDRTRPGWETLASVSAANGNRPVSALPDLPGKADIEMGPVHGHQSLALNWNGPPRFRLQLDWNGSRPPAWVEPATLGPFHAKLGQVLAANFTRCQVLAAKHHLQDLFDQLPIGIFTIGPDFTLERANRSFIDQVQLDFRDVIGRKCFDILCKRTIPRRLCPLETDRGPDSVSEVTLNGVHELRIVRLPVIDEHRGRSLIGFMQPRSEPVSHGAEPGDFSRLYNQLSQPLTSLCLLSELLNHHHNPPFERNERRLLGLQVQRIVSILKQENRAFERTDPRLPPIEEILLELMATDADRSARPATTRT